MNKKKLGGLNSTGPSADENCVYSSKYSRNRTLENILEIN